MKTQSKTMSTKINQTSSQIRSKKCLLIFQLRSARCSFFELNQPYLHEPMYNTIHFFPELLGINASVDQWWNSLIIILHMISWYHTLDKNMIVKYVFLPTFIANPFLWILFWYFRASKKDWKKLYWNLVLTFKMYLMQQETISATSFSSVFYGSHLVGFIVFYFIFFTKLLADLMTIIARYDVNLPS